MDGGSTDNSVGIIKKYEPWLTSWVSEKDNGQADAFHRWFERASGGYVPKLSVITVNRNNKSGLRRTIQSVLSQTFSDYEFIIIDGASTDGSADEIRKVQGALAYWVTEPDTGIYNAMNKGIEKATGDYCLFLNSGDCLADSTVLDRFFSHHPKDDVVIGNAVLLSAITGGEDELFKSPDYITFLYLYHSNIPHQATFIRRSAFAVAGSYNESNLVVSDWEFVIKALCLHNLSYGHVDIVVSICEPPGLSRNPKYLSLMKEERDISIKNNFRYVVIQQYEMDKLFNSNVGYLFIWLCKRPRVFGWLSSALRLVAGLKNGICGEVKSKIRYSVK